MYIGLRTTIFWNLCLLMALSSALVSFVVYRVTSKEVLKQGELSGRVVFAGVEAGVQAVLQDRPEAFKAGSASPELEALCKRHVDAGICLELLLVNDRYEALADTRGRGGRLVYDDDVDQAIKTGSVFMRVERRFDAAGPRLIFATPVRGPRGLPAGGMKMVLPLQGIQRSMKNAVTVIFLYVLTNAGILMIVGYLIFSRYIISPMQRLTRLTEKIAQDNLAGVPLFLAGGNEMSKLSSALKALAENLAIERGRLQRQMQALEEKNQQLQQAQREIIQSEKLASVGRLAAGIAHEVGNPVGIILGYIHMLRSPDASDAQRADYLNRLEHETERVKNIIGDLLDFAQPSSQELTQLQLNTIVADTCAMIAHNREFKDIRVEQQLAADLPLLRGNETLLRQMLLNLVLNACDAMAGTGGTLMLTTALDTGAAGGKICLTVADTGRGIAPEHQEKIFDPFFTTKDQGTGLGLSNVHRIVELIAGTISVTSVPGQGTAFTIHFPGAES